MVIFNTEKKPEPKIIIGQLDLNFKQWFSLVFLFRIEWSKQTKQIQKEPEAKKQNRFWVFANQNWLSYVRAMNPRFKQATKQNKIKIKASIIRRKWKPPEKESRNKNLKWIFYFKENNKNQTMQTNETEEKRDENDYLTRVNARCYERDTLKQRRNNHQWWKQWWKMIVNQQFHRCWWWWWSNKIYLFFFQKINKPERQWNCKNSTHK